MTVKLSDVMVALSAEDLKHVRKRSRVHLRAMEDAHKLDDIRRAADRRQGDVAVAMGIGQNAVSQMEKRSDIQLSTLNRYVESIGFRLELAVIAPSGERISLKKFRPWDEVTVRKTNRPSSTDASTAKAKGTKTPNAATGVVRRKNAGSSAS